LLKNFSLKLKFKHNIKPSSKAHCNKSAI